MIEWLKRGPDREAKFWVTNSTSWPKLFKPLEYDQTNNPIVGSDLTSRLVDNDISLIIGTREFSPVELQSLQEFFTEEVGDYTTELEFDDFIHQHLLNSVVTETTTPIEEEVEPS